MPDAFFASSKKRKRLLQGGGSRGGTSSGASRKAARTKNHAQGKKPASKKRDEELESDGSGSDIDDMDLRAEAVDSQASDTEELRNETPAEKRLRLAKIYLESVKEGLAEGEFDAAEIDRNIISARLKEDVLENAGKTHIFIASSLSLTNPAPSCLRLKPHRMTVTSAIISNDATRLYTAGKEGGIACSDVVTGKRLSYTPKLRPQAHNKAIRRKGKGKAPVDGNGHSDEIFALAISGDGKYLASGGKDRKVCVWDEKKLVWVKEFVGHKDGISGLSFRKSTNMLYSSSFDRTIKLFDLSPGVMGYVETLFGHQDSITGLDSLKGDTAVSTGGRDRTVRFWKITEETQLVFRGGGSGKSKLRDMLETGIEDEEEAEAEKKKKKGAENERWIEGSVDCVAMVDEQTFISGGDSGSINLWSINKKKPIFTWTTAHGLEETESTTEGTLRRPRWIMSLTCLRYGDMFASGSWDGHIRLWKLDPSLRSFARLGLLPVPGLINSLQLTLIPKEWTCDDAWPRPREPQPEPLLNVKSRSGSEGVLLVAAIGQEPRLGRWTKLKGDGVVNSAVIFSIRNLASNT
ncbi:WD40 repeat-like protein [Hysterangium stoloniferum]|nr:WD40 repeat-like protein [Hysterangium stoloniferum]